MTYQELADMIKNLTEEQKKQNVTAYVIDTDEYYPISKVEYTDESCDVLDNNHMILIA